MSTATQEIPATHEFWTPERMTKLREKLGWSREKMASHLGTHERSVHRWETGESKRVRPMTIYAYVSLAQDEHITLADL